MPTVGRVPGLCIDGRTRVTFIVGDPIAQVRSPEQMNPVFAARGIALGTPIAVRVTSAAYQQIANDIEECSRVHGAGWLAPIAEQPQAIADTLLGRLSDRGDILLDEVRLTDQDLRDVDKVFIIACGTAYHAGMIAISAACKSWQLKPHGTL